MMRAWKIALALLVLLSISSACSAGPIDFSYTTSATAQHDPGIPSPGDLQFSLTPSGNVAFPETGGYFTLGGVEFRSSPAPLAPDAYTAYTDFDVSVAVTDAASGRTRTLTLSGSAVDEWMYRPWDGQWLNTYRRLELGKPNYNNADSTSIILGGTQYTLYVAEVVGPDDHTLAGTYILSATAATPEPGTLVLAALGVVPFGLRRLRRMW